ncbi:glycoside hydrolase family 19 protein [Paenibacillus tyrfis]|uniref:glycoside hydrolase family 19 protein n=1 Tax=Paenibacillus tyrfis TaxID=1501230 RepID=UPI00068DBDC2|nr:glycoside hydrolase family 19 protein [Paenibacillus tyrfis]
MKPKFTRKKAVRASVAALSALLALAPLEPVTTIVSANAGQQAALAASPWVATQVYVSGNEVSYNGKIYRAKWWTQGDTPGTGDPSSSPWQLVGSDTGGGNDSIPPTAPTNLASTGQTADMITLTWTAATDNIAVAGYDIYRNGTKVGSSANASTLTYTDTGLQQDTEYTYYVAARDGANNTTASTSIKVKTSLGGLNVGQSRVLTDSQIASIWGGIDPQYSPSNAVAAVQSALPQAEYEALFPIRIGSPEWHTFAASKPYYKPGQGDYYSYNNLIAAVSEVANIKYKLEYRQGATWNHRIFRLDKAAKTETLIYQNADFNASWNLTVPIVSKTVDFGSFLKEGSAVNRKREMAAFLANIAHETGGGWATAPGGELRWGLFWNEEVDYINSTNIGYVQTHADYPPVAGKSYHGRGPIQLSWNYNYGLFSGIIYGNKNTLLQQPEHITSDGKLGFMTAILFWMTPQPPKPSAHDVMVGNWTPSAEETAKGLTPPGFGITIMIINGNLEGNKDETDNRIGRRVGHYRDITTKMGVDITGEKLSTLGMSPF